MQTARVDDKKLCFVIGPIGADRSEDRKAADFLLRDILKPVLEAIEFNYVVRRSDEDSDPGMIGDKVVTDIIHADLVVADLTNLNPNAFYELGIRHSTLKPTIHLAKSGTALPFDNISHRTIFIDFTDWDAIEQGRARLAEAARAIANPGFQVSNPITQANVSFKMRDSADPRDRIIVEMQDRFSSLEQQITQSIGLPKSTSAEIPLYNVGRNVPETGLFYLDEKELLTVDTRPLLGDRGSRFVLAYNYISTVKELLDTIYYIVYRIDQRAMPAYTYNTHWVLEDSCKQTVFEKIRSKNNNISLARADIKPGMHLLVRRR